MCKKIKAVLVTTLLMTSFVTMATPPLAPDQVVIDLTKILDGATAEAQVIKKENGEELALRYENLLLKARMGDDVKAGLLPVELTMNLSSTGKIRLEDVKIALAKFIAPTLGMTFDFFSLEPNNNSDSLLNGFEFRYAGLTEKLRIAKNADGSFKLSLIGKVDGGLLGLNEAIAHQIASNTSTTSQRLGLSGAVQLEYKKVKLLGYLDGNYVRELQDDAWGDLDGSNYGETIEKRPRIYGESFKQGIEISYELTSHLQTLDAWGVDSRVKIGAERRQELLLGDLGVMKKSDWKAKVSFETDFGKVSENKQYKGFQGLSDADFVKTMTDRGLSCNGRFTRNYYGTYFLKLLSGEMLESKMKNDGWASKEEVEASDENLHKIAVALRTMIKSGRCIERDL